MSEKKNHAERYFDKRTVRHYLDRAIISREDLKARADALEDCAELAGETETRMEHSAQSGE